MRFSIIAFAAALFGQATFATPVTSDVAGVASLPIPPAPSTPRLVNSSVPLELGALRHGVGPHPDEIDIVMLLCKQTNCNDCTFVDLMGLNADECFSQNFAFVSTAVIQPNAPDLPFITSVGPLGCAQLLALPAQNNCFNIQGATFQAFDLVLPPRS